jgi:L,D-transpeptidase catalytic domain
MTFTIDRRRFVKAGLAGAALAASPAGFAQDRATRDLLLARARTALDRLHDRFALRDRVAIADFTVHSRERRFHIVDLIGGQVFSYLCAHGKGSDPEHSGFLQRFSNEEGSLATSRGAYMTGPMYDGVHGRAMRLIGMETDNSNADPRAIVMHSADYVGENHIATWGKIGRSEGCFVFAPHMLPQVLALLGPGRMLFADKA